MPSQPPPPLWKTGVEPRDDDMANRGMLPKFRPATLGLTASVRPLIRPVKALPAPPVPSPPRRSEAVVESQAAIETERLLGDGELDMATANGVGESSTLNRGPVTVPREMVQATPRGGRGNVMHLQLDDETQARPIDAYVPLHAPPLVEKLRYDAVVTPLLPVQADLAVDYDALPSLEVRAVYDLEDEIAERDPEPITQAAIRESAHVRRVEAREREDASYRDAPQSYEEPVHAYRAPEPSYREPDPSYAAHAEVRQDEEELWGRREGSGPRSRPVLPDPPRSYAALVPAYDDDSHSQPWGDPPPLLGGQSPVTVGYPGHPPQGHYPSYEPEQQVTVAPRLPEEMRGVPAFVVGVQPIRTATPDAWGTPQAQGQPYPQGYHPQGYVPLPMQAMQQAMPAGYGVAANQVHPYVMQGRVAQPTPWPSQPQGPQAYYPSQHPPQHPSSQPQAYYPSQHPPQRNATPMPMPSSRPVTSVARPVGAQLAPVSTSAKVGHFAWFVAGAAFGVTFAFFATGFFSGSGSAKSTKDEPGAPVPTMTQAAQAQAPQMQVPQQLPVFAQPPAANAANAQQPQPPQFAQQPQLQPQFAPPQAQQPVFAQPPVANAAFAQPPVVGLPQPPVATSPANLPNAQRPQPVAQRPAPPPRAPRPAPPPRRPTRSADDGPAAPAPAVAPTGGGDLNDLLGAGLKP